MTIHAATLNKEPFQRVSQDGSGEIIAKLLQLHTTDQLHELTLLNIYKEVPISAAARAIRFADNAICCQTNETQARAIEYIKETIIKNPHLQHDLHASACYCPETREVALSDFSYIEMLTDKRSSIRVRMHIPMKVLIEAGTNKIPGRMLDLSLAACAVDLANGGLLGNLKYVHINLAMPPARAGMEAGKLRVMARLTKTFQKERLLSCVFHFEHSKSSEEQIGKLVAMRQMEIIRELK